MFETNVLAFKWLTFLLSPRTAHIRKFFLFSREQERTTVSQTDKTFDLKMKMPNNQKVVRTYRSASDHQVQKPKLIVGKPLVFKFNTKVRNSACLKSKCNNHISETTIIKNLITLEDSLPNSSSSESPLIPTPKTPKNSKEVLQKSLIKLKSVHWNDSVSALRDIVQISRFNPHLLTKSMPAIYKEITAVLKSPRITAARTACQAVNELFMNMPSDQGPEFIELIHTLLQKTTDPNKHLRKDALEALDSMVIHVPPAQTIKILLHRRIAGYNAKVRTVTSKLLACVLGLIESHSTTNLSEELKIRMVHAAIRFLQDDTYDIKFHGMRLMTTLMHHNDFEKVLKTKISADVLNQVHNFIETVKNTIRHSST